MSDDIMVCRGCDEEYDAEDHVPYMTSTCFHNICKQCKEQLAPMQCPNCEIGWFTSTDSRPNFIAHVLLQQAQNDRTLIDELLGNLEELKFNPAKPKRDVTPTPPTSPTEPGPSRNEHPLAPRTAGLMSPSPLNLPPAAPPAQGYIPSLGSPPTNRRPAPQNLRETGNEANYGPSDLPPPYSRIMPRSPYMEKKQNGYKNTNSSNNVVTVKNLNPNWTIPDINERFGVFGTISKRYSQKNSNGSIKQIDIHYLDGETAKDVVFAMNNQPNDCGGDLIVHFKVYTRKNNSKKSRPFDPERTVCIGNWGPDITEDDLRELFGKYGRVIACRRNLDQHGKLTGTALLEFSESQCARTAIAEMHMQLIPAWGIKLTVDEFVPRNYGK